MRVCTQGRQPHARATESLLPGTVSPGEQSSSHVPSVQEERGCVGIYIRQHMLLNLCKADYQISRNLMLGSRIGELLTYIHKEMSWTTSAAMKPVHKCYQSFRYRQLSAFCGRQALVAVPFGHRASSSSGACQHHCLAPSQASSVCTDPNPLACRCTCSPLHPFSCETPRTWEVYHSACKLLTNNGFY